MIGGKVDDRIKADTRRTGHVGEVAGAGRPVAVIAPEIPGAGLVVLANEQIKVTVIGIVGHGGTNFLGRTGADGNPTVVCGVGAIAIGNKKFAAGKVIEEIGTAVVVDVARAAVVAVAVVAAGIKAIGAGGGLDQRH